MINVVIVVVVDEGDYLVLVNVFIVFVYDVKLNSG